MSRSSLLNGVLREREVTLGSPWTGELTFEFEDPPEGIQVKKVNSTDDEVGRGDIDACQSLIH